MNFYNDDEKKEGAPVTPSIASPFKKTSAFGKSPAFSRAAGGIMDRLKNLSRKDMAFVGIGLSVLIAVPTAEFMMSQPAKDDLLQSGFGTRDAAGAAGANGLYEPGINALSQGSPDGSSEVITPLSSRDPASLILGAQPAQPVMPPSVPQTMPTENYRDSVKEAARNSFAAAAASSGAPTPIPRMSAALRGMGSFFTGGEGTRTSGTLGNGKILDDAKSASAKTTKRSMVGPVAIAGYKGVASNTPNSASKGAFEKLRAAADKAAGNFNGDSAIRSLDKAAADSVDLGKGGGGMGAGQDSEKVKAASNSNNKDSHSSSGESLAQMAAKQRLQKALDWEFYKKYDIPKQFINAIVSSVSSSIGKFAGGIVDSATGQSGGGGAPAYVCLDKIDQSKNCLPKNVQAIAPASSDDKTVSGWFSDKGPCPCKAMKESDYKAMMGIADNANGGGAAQNNSSVNPATPEQVSATAKDFDTQLVALLQIIKKAVEKKDDPKDLLKYTKEASKGVVQLMSGNDATKNLPGIMNNVSAKVSAFSASAEKFNSDYNNAAAALASAEEAANKFVTDAGKLTVKGSAEQNKLLTSVKGIKGTNDDKTTDPNVSLVTAVQRRIAQMNDRIGQIQEAKKDVAFQGKVAQFYRGQVSAMSKNVGNIKQTAAGFSSRAQALKDKLDNIKDEQAAAQKAELDKALDELWAKKDGAIVAGMLTLRGVPPETTIDSEKLDDSKAVKAEDAMWKSISPRASMDTGKDKFEGKDGTLADDMISSIKRGVYELPYDVASLQGEPENAVNKLAKSVNDDVAAFRKELGLDKAADAGNKPADNPTAAKEDATVDMAALKGSVGTSLSDYDKAMKGLNDYPAKSKIAKAYQKPYGTMVADYQDSAAYKAVSADRAKLAALKVELDKGVDNKRAGEIKTEVAAINSRLAANQEAARQKLIKLQEYAAQHPATGNTGSSGAATYTNPVKPTGTYQTSGASKTPPATVDQLRLVKVSKWVPALDRNNKQVTYKEAPVLVKISDYSLAVGSEGEAIVMSNPTAPSASGLVWYTVNSMKRDEFDMEVKLSCKRSGNGWVIDTAGLRKGLNQSNDQLGGNASVQVSGKVLGVGAAATMGINYSHTWFHYRFGTMENDRTLSGKPCR